jgi:hypothetical protein
MRSFIIAGMIVLFVCGNVFPSEVEIAGFDRVVIEPGKDIKAYDVIYLEEIDLSGVDLGEGDLFYDYDNESGGILAEEDEKEDLAYKFRRKFERHLEKVMPVEWRPVQTKGKTVLNLLVKISGELREAGIIENLLPGKNERGARLSIEGKFVDASTGEDVLYFYSEHSSPSSGEDDPVMYTDDREEWIRAVDKWAAALSGYIAEKKGKMYMEAPSRT